MYILMLIHDKMINIMCEEVRYMMEQWNKNTEDNANKDIDKENSPTDEKDKYPTYEEIQEMVDKEVTLMNYEFADWDGSSRYGRYQRKRLPRKDEGELKWSFDNWARYQYLCYLYRELSQENKRSIDADINLDINQYNEENFSKYREILLNKSGNVNELYEFNRKIKNQLNNTIRSILEDYVGMKEYNDNYLTILTPDDYKQKSMTKYDIVFWDYVYNNRIRINKLMQKQDISFTENDTRTLYIIYANFVRIAKKENNNLVESEFKDMWEKRFPDTYITILENEIKLKIKELKTLIFEEMADKNERIQFLQEALYELQECYDTIDSCLDPYVIAYKNSK